MAVAPCRRARATALVLVAVGVLGGLAAPASGFELIRPAVVDDLAARTAAAALATEQRCRPPAGTPVPDMVGQIFRCRLRGVASPEEARRVAAEAVVVAQCESLFDPEAIVFDGAYVDRPHPRTGLRYTAAGVFQFIRATAEDYVRGGYAAATEPVANINAAVDLYLDNRRAGGRGWESWECSAVNGAFKASSVLPGWPGGPPTLPPWAWDH